MDAWADLLLDWIAAHPQWAGALTFLIAFVETLLIIGFFVPGTILLFGVGVLVGQGSVPLEVAAASLIIGGVAGDAFGYWLGKRYRDRVLNLRFFQKRQQTIDFATRLIHRHTGKALLLARLVGQIRPIVPFIAGVVDIAPGKFFFYNMLSAVLAAALHLIPGLVVGIGLRFSGAVTARLAVLLVAILAVLYLVYFLAKRARGLSMLFGPGALERLMAWTHAEAASRRPILRQGARALVYLLDRERLEVLGMAAIWLVVVGLFAGLIALLRGVLAGDPIADANRAVAEALVGLRNPLADSAMAVIGAIGEAPVVLALSAAVLAMLLVRRAWLVAAFWALATGIAFASTILIGLIAEARAGDGGVLGGAAALPEGDAAISVTIFGYFAVLATEQSRSVTLRLVAFALALAFVSLLSIAQLYLGRLYVSGLAGGFIVGIAALLILTAATWRHLPQLPRGASALVGWGGVIVLVLAGAINASTGYAGRIATLAPTERVILVEPATWEAGGWMNLAAYRIDFLGQVEEPVNLQLAIAPAALEAVLSAKGWQRPGGWDLVSIADLMTGSAPESADARPVLPRFWEGRREALVLVKRTESGRHVLHLWDEGHRLDGAGDRPLLLGTVERETPRASYLYGLIALPPAAGEFSAAAYGLFLDLPGARLEVRQSGRVPPPARRPERAWDGSTVILPSAAGD
jgi:undecaprenyl-diphosphatase